MLPPFLSPLIVQLLNALLAREGWARERLRPHAGKSVRLVLGTFDITLAVSAGGGVEGTGHTLPNVTVRIAGADLPRMLNDNPEERMQAVRIEGEAALAHAVSDLARDLRWDVEDDVARLIGDIPARALLQTIRTAGQTARDTGTRLGQNAIEYLRYEARLLPDRAAISAWSADVRALDQATQLLSERVASLERRRGRV